MEKLSVHGFEDSIFILPQLIYRLNTLLAKILARYFVSINKLILTFIWKGKGPRIASTILKDKVEELTPPGFKTPIRLQ